MLRPLPRSLPLDLLERPRPFPTLDRAFDAVERAVARLGIEDPASLPTPQVVEDDLSPTALPQGTLLVLNPDEYIACEVDIHDTVLDERLGGTVYGTMERPPATDERRRRLREMGGSAVAFGFLPPGTEPYGTGRVRQVRTPAFLGGYRFLVADVPGFRVALIRRALPGGGFLALWSGAPEVVDEITRVLQRALQADGHGAPAASPAVPARDVVPSSAALWKQAEELRAYRTVREAELRQIARAAALRGVELRREREADSRAAS